MSDSASASTPKPDAAKAAKKASLGMDVIGLAVLHGMVVVHTVLFIVSLFSNRSAFFNAVLAAMVSYLILLIKSRRPAPSRDYLAFVANDNNGHYFFWTLIFVVLPVPAALFLGPLCIVAAASLRTFASIGPAFLRASVLGKLWAKWDSVVHMVPQVLYVLEIEVGIFALVTVVLPGQGSIVQTALYWIVLSMRYNATPAVRQAFAGVKARFDQWFYNPKCPGFVRNIYLGIGSFLWRGHSLLAARLWPAQRGA